jgi:hypothetical protein
MRKNHGKFWKIIKWSLEKYGQGLGARGDLFLFIAFKMTENGRK